MKSKSKYYARLFEKVLNDVIKERIEIYYGVGTKIKIRDFIFSYTKKECIIDAVVILGSNISDDLMEDSPLIVEITELTEIYLEDYKIGVQIKFDC